MNNLSVSFHKLIIYSIPFLILSTVWYYSLDDFFFWDTVQLGSKQAHFFYPEFKGLILPKEIDSGHFPLFGIYISTWWKIFGKSLEVSHLAMLPWVVFLSIGIVKLSSIFLEKSHLLFGVLLLSIEPTLLAQTGLVSPDIILITCFIWSLVFYFTKNNASFSILLIVLSLISLRGLILTFCLFMYQMYESFRKKEGKINIFSAFVPAFLINLFFLINHYFQTQWIGFHTSSPWAPSFHLVSIADIAKNIILFVWRIIDFGRIYIVAGCIFLWYFYRKKLTTQTYEIIRVLLITGTIFFLLTIFFQSLTAHRYYMPLYIIFIILFVRLLSESGISKRMTNIIVLLGFLSLISGHFWKYPDHIAKGWDGSLAYKPVFSVYKDVSKEMENKNIPKKYVSSFFPLLSEQKYIFLNENREKHATWNNPAATYLLLSNIHNDAPDSLYQLYRKEKAIILKEKGGIWMALHKIKK
jgi:hypothetical protein